MPRAVHHLELWVSDLARSSNEWEWLLGELGWESDVSGEDAFSWVHPDGTYLFMESSADLVDEPHDRMRPGMNHLALTAEDRGLLDRIRGASTEHGWHELFADRYPHAGGDGHTALYLESSEGFEVELVVEAR
ncbi:MAG: hypothetical protein JWR35_2793 [Marmoricola sp.]|jgi:catechol 2,3-dioxygenase-like lactoylglutathione lyase family enzyme|nr:hypothetical protein [Marmoricola sp.]